MDNRSLWISLLIGALLVWWWLEGGGKVSVDTSGIHVGGWVPAAEPVWDPALVDENPFL